ncbi:uncharacterized protein TNCV_2786951 [Trichonephila clavipes]|nr:uncharacterized protein TNCV_2786951 [Trichonephila clavipes]
MWVEVVASAMFRVWLCLVPVLLTVAPGPAAPTGPSGSEKINITEILNSFFDKGYDKRVRPNYGGTAIRRFSSGRPRGTTPADDRYIVLQARRNRRQTAGEMARHRRLDDRYRVLPWPEDCTVVVCLHDALYGVYL